MRARRDRRKKNKGSGALGILVHLQTGRQHQERNTAKQQQNNTYFASRIPPCPRRSDQDERGVIHCERETFAR